MTTQNDVINLHHRTLEFLILIIISIMSSLLFFFFNNTATTEIYTLSLHDALPISGWARSACARCRRSSRQVPEPSTRSTWIPRSEEHTSELQSHHDLVCRLLLEKKKKT